MGRNMSWTEGRQIPTHVDSLQSNVALWRLTVATPLVAIIWQHRMSPKLPH
jgi:hypothetical protein